MIGSAVPARIRSANRKCPQKSEVDLPGGVGWMDPPDGGDCGAGTVLVAELPHRLGVARYGARSGRIGTLA